MKQRRQFPHLPPMGGTIEKVVVKTDDAGNFISTPPTCRNCQFNIYNGAYTECRRYPPPWVRVADTEWCGEHKRRLEAK